MASAAPGVSRGGMMFFSSSSDSFGIFSFLRLQSARMRLNPSCGLRDGKRGILTSTLPGRLRSTSMRSGRLDARTQRILPRLRVFDISFAIME